MKAWTNLDYVRHYARCLKEDNSHFKEQKMLIDSQIRASQSLFSNAFKGDFRKQARQYLVKIGLLQD